MAVITIGNNGQQSGTRPPAGPPKGKNKDKKKK